MRTAAAPQSDLTAKARIRETAMERFAGEGVAATSLRSIARAAGVSPALVVHHFGSKEGLIRAVDEAVLRRINLALTETPLDAPTSEVVAGRGEMMAAFFRRQPLVADYLGRALSEGTEASVELFHRMFEFAARDERLVEAGVMRGDADHFWRAVHQIVLVVGPLILRPLIERELGGDLLEEGNLTRWTKARADLLERGLYLVEPNDGDSDAHAA